MKEEYTLKDILSQMINICTRVVTLIFAISTLVVLIFNNSKVNYSLSDVWSVLIIGIISGLAFIIFYIPKKISKKLMAFLQFIYFVIINTTVMLIGFHQNWFDTNNKSSVFLMELMFLLVYIIVTILVFVFDIREANKMNKLLAKRKKIINAD